MEPTQNPSDQPQTETPAVTPTPAPVVYDLTDLPRTIRAILQFVKDQEHAVTYGDIKALHLPYTKTAFAFLERNRYFKEFYSYATHSYRIYTNPAKQEKVGKLLASQF